MLKHCSLFFSLKHLANREVNVPAAAQSDGCFGIPCCAAGPAGEREPPPQPCSCGVRSLCSPVKSITDRCFQKALCITRGLTVGTSKWRNPTVFTCSSLRRSSSSSTFLSDSRTSLFNCFKEKKYRNQYTISDGNLGYFRSLMQ